MCFQVTDMGVNDIGLDLHAEFEKSVAHLSEERQVG
jgi:hypothetical protein